MTWGREQTTGLSEGAAKFFALASQFVGSLLGSLPYGLLSRQLIVLS